MTDAAVWDTIGALRAELIDQLVELPAERWDEPSLCPGWRIRDVVAHTILPERFSPFGGLVGLARAGFSLRRLLHTDAIRRGSAPLEELIASFREAIDRQVPAPGRTPQHLLDDLYVHARDIRRPLGLAAPEGSPSYRTPVLTGIADTIAADSGLGVPARIAGLRLTATDIQWTHGDGAEIRGTAEALVLAMTGRKVVLPELTGPGVALLAARS
jgi:uncharacterized protein (TIGR03083 family)